MAYLDTPSSWAWGEEREKKRGRREKRRRKERVREGGASEGGEEEEVVKMFGELKDPAQVLLRDTFIFIFKARRVGEVL